MHRIALAFRAFFRILGDALVAQQVEQALSEPAAALPAPAAEPSPMQKPAPQPAARNDALTLLAALQREARLVDFLQEPIASYNDAQIGAAVRDIHRDSAALLERIFGLRPVEAAAEGAEIQIDAGFDAARVRLVGNVTGQPPFQGRLCHHGWEATRCELPAWTGSAESLQVVAPAEVELR